MLARISGRVTIFSPPGRKLSPPKADKLYIPFAGARHWMSDHFQFKFAPTRKPFPEDFEQKGDNGTDSNKARIIERTIEILKPQIFNGTSWIAGYRRIRIVAHKKNDTRG